jgi:oligoendopeptidase F
VWNRYYAPVLGHRDSPLLAIYSHMIHSFLYLPDYALGHMIAFQIKGRIDKSGDLGGEFQRMASQGRLTPDLWMTRATGSPVGPEALLEATREALDSLP